MRVNIKKGLCMLLTAALAVGCIQKPVSAQNVNPLRLMEEDLIDSTEELDRKSVV